MTRATVRLFVYGSLKRGGRHHDELQAVGAAFLGEAETLAGYRLEALNVGTDETDGYLALVRESANGANGANVVAGELFEVPESALPALDAFEGDAYARGPVMLARPQKPSQQIAGQIAGQIARTDDDMESLAYFRKAR